MHAFSWCEDGLDCPVETTMKARGSSEGQCGLQQFKQESLPIRNSKDERHEAASFEGESNVDGNHFASVSHCREVSRGLKPRLSHNSPSIEGMLSKKNISVTMESIYKLFIGKFS